MMKGSWQSPEEVTPAEILTVGAWFGLAAGLLEGIAYLCIQKAGLLGWEEFAFPIDSNILWLAISVDALLFLGFATFLALLGRFLQNPYLRAVILMVFATLALFHPLSVSGRLSLSARAVLAVGCAIVLGRFFRKRAQMGTPLLRKTLAPMAVVGLIFSVGGYLWPHTVERMLIPRFPKPSGGDPNVLIIVLDTLRADRVGVYGYPRPTTDFLDSLAKQSTLFMHAMSTSSWTLPAHGSLFTGLLPGRHGAVLWKLEENHRTLAQAFRERGYGTAGFAANLSVMTTARGVSNGFNRWFNAFTGPWDSFRRTVFGRMAARFANASPYIEIHGEPGQMTAAEVNRRFLAWMDKRIPRPYFAYLNYMEVHQRYNPPHEFAKKFSAVPEQISAKRTFQFTRQKPVIKEPQAMQNLSDGYDASLAYLDSQLRTLFAELNNRGALRNTLVVILGDHGTAFGEHGLVGHRRGLYLDQIHVPLMIHWPGKVPAGQTVEDAVGIQDLTATIAELTELSGPGFPGGSLVHLLEKQPGPEHIVISELTGQKWSGFRKEWPIAQGWLKSIMKGQWHLILKQNGEVELFDWKKDPAEQNNLFDAPESLPTVHSLIRDLQAALPGLDLNTEAPLHAPKHGS